MDKDNGDRFKFESMREPNGVPVGEAIEDLEAIKKAPLLNNDELFVGHVDDRIKELKDLEEQDKNLGFHADPPAGQQSYDSKGNLIIQ
jgi:hypothetical protein